MIEAPPPDSHVLQPGQGKRAPREIAHPLPPELLVAHLSGELPPAAAYAVGEHLAECDACAARAQALAGPYGTLSTLGSQSVAFVPDLRRSVREHWAHSHALARAWRAMRLLGGGGLAGAAAIAAMILVLTLFVITNTFQAPVILARSTNGAGAISTVAGAGLLYAETSKIMDVTAADGEVWTVAEVIAIDQSSAAVLRSLPRDAHNLRVGAAGEFPTAVALSPSGNILYEISAPANARQALLAIDAHTGALLFATPLAQPNGAALPAGELAHSIAIAPDGQRVYLDVSQLAATSANPDILVLDHQGRTRVALLRTRLDPAVHEPPPTNGLPGVAAPQSGPVFSTVGLLRAPINGGLVVSADGRSLFVALTLSNGTQSTAIIVSRIDAFTGQSIQAVALPGSFAATSMATGQTPTTQLLYLAQVGSQGGVYVIDVGGTDLIVHSEIPLGGLSVPPHTAITGVVSVSSTASGTQAYISADTSSASTGVSSHDIWLVDGLSNTVASHRIEFINAGQAMPNGATSEHDMVFIKRGAEIVLLPADLALSSSPPVWLRLADGLPLRRLIATAVS